MLNPRISVLITAYNCAGRVGPTIESVLAQTYPAHEIIVVNDGSKDDTEKILLGFGQKIRYIRQENQGVAVARNTGIRVAQGDWIALLDDDDIWLPEKLGEQARLIARYPDAGAVFTAYDLLLADGRRLAFPELHPYAAGVLRDSPEVVPDCFYHLFMENFAKPSTLVLRADLLRANLFKAERVPAEDRDVILRIAAKAPVLYCAKSLVDKYLLSGSMGEERLRVVDMRETVQKENRRNFDALFRDKRWKKMFRRAVASTKRQRVYQYRAKKMQGKALLAAFDYVSYRFLRMDLKDRLGL